MFDILKDKTICLTRGDIAVLDVSANKSDGEYTFASGDVVRLKVFQKNKCDNVVLTKDVTAVADEITVSIELTSEDTRIGEIINKPMDYWYEIELNPDTAPQTLIGYDSEGPKIFRLYPEGGGFN